ncbi:MAG: glycosyltransferase family 2 protein [Bdellovibrionales bacterium]|nr:glycosyltransferase family 2 protein [Bdellovibrionales bacterium]
MNHPTCILIPIFNHGSTIESVVDSLQGFSLPLIIVDDGSDRSTTQVLEKLEQRYDRLRVIYRAANGGKGAAMRDAFAAAFEQGFVHAIQVDADGQHDVQSIPKFLQVATKPRVIVLGKPRFDASAPRIRCWGRKLTTWLIWLETLSFNVKDGLCGFRLYPVKESHQVISTMDCGKRMDFDPSILVHLVWEGVEVEHVETFVRYPQDGISNFRYVRDNFLITCSHFKLIGKMLARVLRPRLFGARKHGDVSAHRWSELKEHGSYTASLLMLRLYRLLGRRFSTQLAKVVATYFYLTSALARRASADYIQQYSRYFPEQSPLSIRKHISEFAIALVDKLAVWNGDIRFEDLVWENRSEFYELLDTKQGFILLGGHVGNIEIGRALSRKHYDFTVNALMYRSHAESFRRILEKLNGEANIAITPLEDIGSDTLMKLQAKVRSGELVTILADRISAGAPEKNISMNFLGAEAEFPTGPFLLASMLECPVYTIFFLREPDGRYRINFRHFANRIDLPRKDRKEKLHDFIASYVKILEQQLEDYPLQWFNFYPFWGIRERSEGATQTKAASAVQ